MSAAFRFAPGFRSAGVACGLKQSGRRDLALLVADGPCAAAGVFTTSLVKAAPVLLDQAALAENPGAIRAVVANAGCANACTGDQGDHAAREMARLAAEAAGCRPEEVLVLSTGVIGVQLNLEKVAAGVAAAAPLLAADQAPIVAESIMTTDTKPKTASASLEISGRQVTIAGVAKGAGMIHPMMATMLAVITTDARIEPALLREALLAANAGSFNCVTVDGDPSTNDTVLVLASGASGAEIGPAELDAFTAALGTVCVDLAKQIAADGEGATKLIEITVRGARAVEDARVIARAIGRSPLVKTAMHGGDPNWGRILAAAGVAGVPFEPRRLALWFGPDADLQLVAGGTPLPFEERAAAALLAGPQVFVTLDLGLGEASGAAWTCDFSAEYVSINADYRT
ncbi:MAG TPA: bifunctional glutamate N-acetyltransferase/amino-acid acetyltransferase ArgJ [Herpetosiphonaceae bacterium]